MRRLRQGYDSIRSRLTGVGLLGASASWTPPPSERATILRLFNFLENRRVLYVPTNFEIPDQVDQSVIEIRNELTEILNLLPERSRAANRVRHLRTASRRFLEGQHPDYHNIAYRLSHAFPHSHGPRHDPETGRLTPGYFVALGELRAVFGLQLSALAVEFEIDVEDDLASIFPSAEIEEPLESDEW